MNKYCIGVCIILLSLLSISYGSSIGWKSVKSNKFDVLIFTQRWPPTVCFMWKENSDSHSCRLPKHDNWTIHGIWPTRYHTMGPQFCNKSLPFNTSALAPIESQLKQSWIDIQNGSKPYSFWKHEWDKHGTCAVTVKEMDSVFKYFQSGLRLLDGYDMMDVLAKVNIVPGRQYPIAKILYGIETGLGKRAQVTCTENKKTNEIYLWEIRICFDKTLQLVDCDGIYGFPTNCDKSKMITYPGHVPHNYHVIQI